MLTQSYVLSRAYTQTLEKEAQLSGELRTLNLSLEEKVSERTRSLAEANEKLQWMATTDSLTKLPNRRAFDERLDEEISRARRYDNSLTLAILDVDRFKSVNDTFGHDVGDVVLVALASTLEKKSRAVDFVARLGGEEFAIILPETTADESFGFLDRLREIIAGQRVHVDGADHSVTISLGLATLADEETAERLYRRADQALYLAKENGRNRVEKASAYLPE